MPIYEFRCLGCGHVFEFLKLKKEAEEMKCPKCNSEEVERVLSVVSVSLKAVVAGLVPRLMFPDLRDEAVPQANNCRDWW
jgi:putative FmdB family regulatory protein